jgi:transposase
MFLLLNLAFYVHGCDKLVSSVRNTCLKEVIYYFASTLLFSRAIWRKDNKMPNVRHYKGAEPGTY